MLRASVSERHGFRKTSIRCRKFMDSSGTYRKASWRLATAVVLLATVLGAADWWLEIARIDDRIGEMAVARANGFTAEHMPNASYFAQSRESIQAGIVKHFKDDFPIVELYDASRLKTFEFVKPGREYVEAALDERQHLVALGRVDEAQGPVDLATLHPHVKEHVTDG